MKKISVIIPNWNGKKYLKTCFDSLRNQVYSDYEIILIDNNSSDDSVEFTKYHYPEVQIIQLSKNTGFAPAVNAGIKVAKSPFIVLLNNDTEVDDNWLSNLMVAADNYPEAAFFASKMLDFKNRDIIDSCGDIVSWSGKFDNFGRLQKDGPKYNQVKYVFGACAGAAMYKKELFNEIGFFDETFFAYLEDIDMSFRAQLYGFKCLFVPEARVYHIGSATFGKRSALSFKLVVKNRLHVIYKNYPLKKLLLFGSLILYVQFRFFLAAILHGFVKDYFWAVHHAIIEHKEMVPKRKKIQSNRKVTLHYLDSIISNHRFTYE